MECSVRRRIMFLKIISWWKPSTDTGGSASGEQGNWFFTTLTKEVVPADPNRTRDISRLITYRPAAAAGRFTAWNASWEKR
jgi:hypothetical protein